MIKIRLGTMRDCNDLLTVYQTTRWFHRPKKDGYTTVEQVKQEHREIGFKKWGWLVAEKDSSIVGEIVFRIEKNPTTGTLGIIRNLDIDVRFQKMGVGSKLTGAAEKIMKDRRALRVVSTTPPEAYNYWMKLGYFARGSLLRISSPISNIPQQRKGAIETIELKDVVKLPKSMIFSNMASPGMLLNILSDIINYGHKGRIFEFYRDNKLLGVGASVKREAGISEFVADVTMIGIDYYPTIIAKVAKSVSRWKPKEIFSIIPTDQLKNYEELLRWSRDNAREIPITKLLT
ncbi:MAG: GNAT family N-acetyltransferase [Candidatus Thorarchaeota archaeon]